MSSEYADYASSRTLLTRVASRQMWIATAHRHYRNANGLLEKLPSGISGVDAAAYLKRQLETLEAEAYRQAQSYPSHWWIFYLRQLSPTVFDCASRNYGRNRGYTERVSALSQKSDDRLPVTPAFGDSQMARSLRLAVTCIRVEEIVLALRCVNAGATLLPDSDNVFRLEMSERLRAALERYEDQLRLNDLKLGAARLGGVYLKRFEPNRDDWSRALVSLFMPELPITPDSLKEHPADELVPFVLNLIYINESLSDIPWEGVQSEAVHGLRLLCSLLRVAWIDLGVEAKVWRVLHEGGLTMHSSSILESYLARVCQEANEWGGSIFPSSITPITVEGALDFLTRLELGRTDRYWGPAIRAGKDFFCIDLTSVTLRIEALIAYVTAGGGSISGYRGKHWEERVQGAIDDTPWRPTGGARGLISKKLKAHGKVFTDVDAVGSRSDQLLIVSCKSWQLGTSLDMGEFAACRNKSKDVVKASLKLQEDLRMLRAHGADNGFDVASFAGMSGVLCITTPFLLTEEDELTIQRDAPDVSIMTLPELKSKLLGEELEMPDLQKWQEYARASYAIKDKRQQRQGRI
ncbi:hypothetical protein ACFW6C_09850 [Streptomyces fungicidicus]|uniref:hypothetical protein n=1 Tax=Streptomyces fungicidicus TaxID=68203 RepID=UPI00331F063F